MSVFYKGFGASLSDSFGLFETMVGVACLFCLLILILAALHSFKKGRLDTGELKMRVFRATSLITIFGVLFGFWR